MILPAAGNKNVIFIMDVTPSNFRDKLEGDLFKSALNTIKTAAKMFMLFLQVETLHGIQ